MNDNDFYNLFEQIKKEMDRRKAEKNSFPNKSHEERLREEFPALQDAWEKYQIVLKLCASKSPEPEEDEDDAASILAAIKARKKNSYTRAVSNAMAQSASSANKANDILKMIRERQGK